MKRGRKSIVEHAMISIGDNIRRDREAQQLSQDQLSRLSKVSRITISLIESGKNSRTSSIIKISRALDVDLYRLMNINVN